MYYNYNTSKIINILLFMIQSLGGKVEIPRLLKLIYFADLNHLMKYGSLITGDTYIAMQTGPTPFNIFLLIQKLLRNNVRISFESEINEYFALEGDYVTNIQTYDSTYLSKSEVDCMFNTIRAYKQSGIGELVSDKQNMIPINADTSDEISIGEIAVAANVHKKSVKYIQQSNKLNVPDYSGQLLEKTNNYSSSVLYSVDIGSIFNNINSFAGEHFHIAIGMSLKHIAFVEILNSDLLPIDDIKNSLDIKYLQLANKYDFFSTDHYVDCSKLYTVEYDKFSTLLNLNPDCFIGKIEHDDIHAIIDTISDSNTISQKMKNDFITN